MKPENVFTVAGRRLDYVQEKTGRGGSKSRERASRAST